MTVIRRILLGIIMLVIPATLGLAQEPIPWQIGERFIFQPNHLRLNYYSFGFNSPPSESDSLIRLKLTDGKRISVEEAWEGEEGIWYRQSGVTYLMQR
jgi:hypothetical protein